MDMIQQDHIGISKIHSDHIGIGQTLAEELTCMFLSRDSLAVLGSIRECFPMERTPKSYGMVAGVRSSYPDTVVRASTFNTCQHHPLPKMHEPLLEFHLKEEVRPTATIPIHWTEKVKADSDRDVALGVLEKVALNEPITWCHRMVVCRKHNKCKTLSPNSPSLAAGNGQSAQHQEVHT